ncbi:MAG TPA: NAD/NADP octopine/nopaline dehydrogenase family protein [Euzebya sp.]|nr:NAD/NADP octopine/nopaline dehydrogenase family protein [Euzebya sp.]
MGRTVAVLGGGHGALTLAADLTLQGHRVRLFELESFRDRIRTVFDNQTIEAVGDVLSGTAHIELVTSDIDAALVDAEVVLVAVPAFGHRTYAELLAPRVKDGQLVTLLPGTLGTLEFARTWHDLSVDPSVVLAETDTFPYATRAERTGVVHAYGRTTVKVGVFPASQSETALKLLGELLDITAASNVLEVGFSSLNPVLHPAGTILNIGRIERSRGNFFIYEEGMTPSVTRVIDALDAERLAIAAAFGLTLPTVAESLHSSGYGPSGTTWETLNGSASLTPISGPFDVNTRYLAEDLPYGLATWSSIGRQVGVAAPLMEALLAVGSALSPQLASAPPRTASSLGLDGLDVSQVIDYVTAGGWAPHVP